MLLTCGREERAWTRTRIALRGEPSTCREPEQKLSDFKPETISSSRRVTEILVHGKESHQHQRQSCQLQSQALDMKDLGLDTSEERCSHTHSCPCWRRRKRSRQVRCDREECLRYILRHQKCQHLHSGRHCGQRQRKHTCRLKVIPLQNGHDQLVRGVVDCRQSVVFCCCCSAYSDNWRGTRLLLL